MKRGSIFEVRRNKAGRWFWHELAGGRIADVAQPYCSKSNAKRAATRRSARAPGSKVRVID